jgi:hypothetical protein
MVSTWNIVKGVFIGLGVILVAYLSWNWVVIPLTKIVPVFGDKITATALQTPTWLGNTLTVLFGAGSVQTWESLIAALAVFAILLFGLYDIIYNFSTFSQGTAWAIAGGLAIIGGVTRIISGVITLLFGGVATIGALGIGIIVVWAVIVAVAMNFAIGSAGIRAIRQANIDQQKVEEVGSKLRKGYGVFKEGAKIADQG